MERLEQKMVLERFLSHHGIEMIPTARLPHYGRRFKAYFPDIVEQINPEWKPWGAKLMLRLAEYVSDLDPSQFIKNENAKPPHLAKRSRSQNRTKAFLNSWEWRSLRYDVLKERGHRCESCGATRRDTTRSGSPVRIEVDHIRPISKFWHLRLDKTNLQVMCRDCNKGKGSRDQTDWRVVGISSRRDIEAN